ncbi:hypothetical protein PPL_01667 [Heterostelium album PN500]|uniref:RRM domain-containing protein n=1 Tax=Heterostelium pallidum (strain ATCC 26659 / Pp 5 / PN500) TaxID=670386 RepID=D3B052_HETP5|nr:hypothetical protein PPL_01667 [Heterostelium album PN500]EFA84676.1 hypothetical protein PPL_01667 [Heterostelium album PN500]|eukprot:XP_020436789.1 hypothetical protein PPL_01667 [Heterostelium album PN500]
MFSREYKDDEDDEMDQQQDGENGVDISSDDDDNDSSDDSDDDDDDDSDDDSNTVSSEAIEHLEIKVRENPYSFEKHLEYINSLRKVKHVDKERLRLARKSCQSVFPLPESVWLPWLEDEKNQNDLDYQQMIDLFELAIKDFLSVRIWIKYCQYIQEVNAPNLMSTKDIKQSDTQQFKTIRTIYERAITFCVDHIVESPLLWAQYRIFEMNVQSGVDRSLQAEYQSQITRIRQIYHNQLACPQIDLEELYTSYLDWENALNDDNNNSSSSNDYKPDSDITLQTRYKTALKQMEEHQAFEEKLTGTGGDTVANWLEYVRFEQKKKPMRALVLFERAISRHADSWQLWSEYLQYEDSNRLVDDNRLFATYDRALRNIYWSGDLWVHYLQSLESHSKAIEMLEQVFERALIAGLATINDFKLIFNARFDYLWRHYRSTVKETSTIQLLRQHFQRYYDYFIQFNSTEVTMVISELLLFWAKFEYRQFKSIEESRKQFDLLLSFNKQYYICTEYIDIELECAGFEKCRTIYGEAAHAEDTTAQVFQDWIDFERLYGDLKQQQHALSSYQKWWAKQEKVIAENMAREQKRMEDAERKRKLTDERSNSNNDRKRQKGEKGTKNNRNSDKNNNNNNNNNGKPPREERKPKIDLKKVLFVSNISFATTVEQLIELFKPFGELDLTEIVTDRKGRSKGIAFVEYKLGESAAKALEQVNGLELQGFKLKVDYSTKRHQQRRQEEKQQLEAAGGITPMDTTTGGAGAETEEGKEINYANTEGKTLFINNLAKTVTKEKMEEFFTGKGFEWTEIRLISKAGGRPFAYMDLPDQENVEKALKMNQKYFMGKILNVARSKPPGGGKAPIPAGQVTKPTASAANIPTRRPTLLIPRGLTKKTNQ